MKDININFTGVFDYIRDKDYEIMKLRSSIYEKNKIIGKLEAKIDKCIEFVDKNYVYRAEAIKEILTKEKNPT